MDPAVAESFRYCRGLARRTGRNFYFSFLTLPKPLFLDMCALYAFMRVTDDLGDDESRSPVQRQAALRSWRGELESILAGEPATHPAAAAVGDMQRRHAIPADYLRAVISGVEQDLHPAGFETFTELTDYCYHVAGAVGLSCIHIWGFTDTEAKDRAVDCGTAFQLTNILRDLRADAQVGRVYLPREDLQRFDYSADDLRNGVRDERFRRLMQFQVQRARSYFERGAALHPLLARPGRPILASMIGIYGRLLRTIERRDYDVFSQRIELSKRIKLTIAACHLLRPTRRPVLP
ncbi:MAG: phytoene/squalene synthase family protein [Planctomycetaceae bacterium]|nr:phytoene/squalene synthase family protein [Planctomycetaceae bacterium]